MRDTETCNISHASLSKYLLLYKVSKPDSSKRSESVEITTLYRCTRRCFTTATRRTDNCCDINIHEPGHEKTCLMSYANNKGKDQPAHPHSLISAFVFRCLYSVMSLVSVTKISSLILASVAEQANLSLVWSETPEDTFCRVWLTFNQKSRSLQMFSPFKYF